MSSIKNDNYLELQLRNKKKVPGVGTYDPDKGYKKITSGLARGWK
jgi:hypothetical protein